jgi:hypothetical protein
LALGSVVLSLPADVGAKKKRKRHKVRAAPVVTQTQTVAVPRGTEGTVTASCPAGTGLLGGGFASSPFSASGGSNFVLDSRMSGPSSWTVRSVNSNPAAGSLTVDAYCRKGAPPLTEVAATTTLPAASPGNLPPGSAIAACPSGQPAVAGGFSSTAAPGGGGFLGPYPHSSFRLGIGTGWRAEALNNTGSAMSFTAFAYCAPIDRAETFANTSASGQNLPVAIDAPSCPTIPAKRRIKGKGHKKLKTKKTKPRQTSVLSGGFATSPPTINFTASTSGGIFVSQARVLSGVWHAAGISIGGRSAGLAASAECGS